MSGEELPPPVQTPRWPHALEALGAVGLTAWCLAGPRTLVSDFSLFCLASLGVLLLGRAGLIPGAPTLTEERRPLLLLAAFTGAGLLALGIWAATHGVQVAPHVLLRSLLLYPVYAYVQQYLTQRYLVLRARDWLGGPGDLQLALGVGAAFGLLHLPFPGLIAPTILAGFVWTWTYLQYGRLWPLALSHALLAVAYFFCFLGRDPFQQLFGG